MFIRQLFRKLHLVSAFSLAAALVVGQGQDFTGGSLIAKNTPGFVRSSGVTQLGPENPAKIIDVSIWLNLHNGAEFDSIAEELYDPSSSRFHSWLKPADLARFTPTAEEAALVSRFLTSHNLRVISVGPNNMFVRAQGSVANVSKAFRVTLSNFKVNGKTYRSNTSDPYVEGPSAGLVRSISGLDSMEMEHPLALPQVRHLPTQAGTPVFDAAGSFSSPPFFQTVCFPGYTTETIGSGSYPTGVYKGNKYYAGPATPGCGYKPADIRSAYNLDPLYREGYDGTGQSIVIIDWCGSPTILDDANAFSAKFGLPPLTSSNFKIINYPGPSSCSGENGEINLDVEWAHAIAPGARIVLLVPPSASFLDTDAAQYFAEISGLGNVISASYGAEELLVSRSELLNQGLLSQIGAMLGVSANFSSGDSGDFTFGFPKFNPPSVSVPAAAPYATAVGGVSVALDKYSKIVWQTGWGNNVTIMAEGGTVYDPPINLGFNGGSGGGPSAFYPKPSYQKKLPGTHRQLPDISWVADPFTGPLILITIPGEYPQVLVATGGTSAACPMFSALWAIANQEAGAPLGQAARYVYSMPASTITDVLPVTSPGNVTATVYVSSKVVHRYTAMQLAEPLEKKTTFYSAIWNYPLIDQSPFVLTFGTDSGLTVTPGWDNVTGMGTPNGKAFADYFNPAK